MPETGSEQLSRVEDAGLNASAPPQQLWVDGWLVRLSPGKAKRARCINAVAAGRMPVADRLRRCEAFYRAAGLPPMVRITPFSLPSGLDAQLAGLGYRRIDDTRVMVLADLAAVPPAEWPADARLTWPDPATFAEQVGSLRGSPPEQRRAHAERLAAAPLPCTPLTVHGGGDELLACGQFTLEQELVGLYDVHTAASARGRGFATALCRRLLHEARQRGARQAYLQVDADNDAARSIYTRLGFRDAYAYHYRVAAID